MSVLLFQAEFCAVDEEPHPFWELLPFGQVLELFVEGTVVGPGYDN